MIDRAWLDELCRETALRVGVQGAQIAVSTPAGMVGVEHGVANAELDLAVTPDTVFQVGSTTKLLTATLLLQLSDDGLLDIDAPVSDVLPDVRLARDDEARAITPRALMSMTSGLDSGPYRDTGDGAESVERYVRLLADLPLISPPGEVYGYTNASTIISGLIAERLLGMSWDDAIRSRILVPAGIAAVSRYDELPYYRVAVGHEPGSQTVVRPWAISRGQGPAGSTLAMSARALATFAGVMLRDGVAGPDTRILSPASVRAMHEPQIGVPARLFGDEWCLGPYRSDWGGVEVFGHPGNNVNGSAAVAWIPERGIAIAATLNTPARAYQFTDAVLGEFARVVLGTERRSSLITSASPVDEATVSGLVGDYAGHGTRYTIEVREGRLFLVESHAVDHDATTDLWEDPIESPLIPAGVDRFVTGQDEAHWQSGHHFDLTFTRDGDGRARYLHDGPWTLARR